jgi:DNA-binding NarL/FixJ family response regulator
MKLLPGWLCLLRTGADRLRSFNWKRFVFLVEREMSENPKLIRVILADDHPAVRQGIRQFLESAPDIQIVAEAKDGEEAVGLIRQYQPDVTVLDIQMPKLSGIEVARQIRANCWAVGILILTSYDDDPFIAAVLKAGANGYLLKTASVEEIICAVRDVQKFFV